MKTLTVTLIILTFLLVGCATPTPAAPTAAPTAAVEPTMVVEPTTPAAPTFSEGGIALTFDPAVASGATLEIVPAAPEDEELPVWGQLPEHRALRFAGYPSQNRYHEPTIYLYEVDSLAARNPSAAATIEALRALLSEQPAAPEAIPLLPLFNATQMVKAQTRYLTFEGGTGVRFLTQYGQGFLPINNQELFYSFQGLTSDGRYYVAAILPVAAPGLAATDDVRAVEEGVIPFPFEALDSGDPAAAVEAYMAEVMARLDATGAADFTPSLDLLDAMVQSLRVE